MLVAIELGFDGDFHSEVYGLCTTSCLQRENNISIGYVHIRIEDGPNPKGHNSRWFINYI